jgi:hypothetical protein
MGSAETRAGPSDLPEVVANPHNFPELYAYIRGRNELGGVQKILAFDPTQKETVPPPDALDSPVTPASLQGASSRDEEKASARARNPATRQQRICGCPWRAFWIPLVVVGFVVLAATGGGVGGVLAKLQRASSSNNLQSAPQTSTTVESR